MNDEVKIPLVTYIDGRREVIGEARVQDEDTILVDLDVRKAADQGIDTGFPDELSLHIQERKDW